MQTCEPVNSLNEIRFIAGGEQYFEFQIYNTESGELLDISNLDLKLLINSITDPSDFNSLNVDGVYKDANTFRVTLTADMTRNMRGVYLQQPVLIDYTGKELRSAQGIIIVAQGLSE